MSFFDDRDLHIHYELEGNPDGYPVLLIAPGGMRSAAAVWGRMPWNPRTALAHDFRLIAMDQRNAGESTAPVQADDGWARYMADQLALLDHLGIERCHVLGMCIGGPYIIGLLRAAPDRFKSAVLLQPVGIDDNRDAFEAMFDQWADAIAADHPEADANVWRAFRDNMWDGEFVLTATPEEVEAIETPMLLLMGDDLYHPQRISREIAARAPHVTFVERWKDEAHLEQADATIRTFLAANTPDFRTWA